MAEQPDISLPQRHVDLEQARETLSEVVTSLKLSDTERDALRNELSEIQRTLERIDRGVLHIAAFGMVSRGKSALLNALVGEDVFEVGPTHGTTRQRQSSTWRIRHENIAEQDIQSSSQGGDAGPSVELIDTPGLNEVDGQARARIAETVARRADLLLFVVAGDMIAPELEALAELRRAQKPIILVFNKTDLYPDMDRDKIYNRIRNEHVRELLKPDDVVTAAARPRAVRVITRRADGSTTENWEQPEADVSAVKLKILEVLEREGRSLLALNTLMYANEVHEEIVARKMELREEAADRLVWRFTISKSLIVACNPIAVADIVGGLGADIAMVFALSRLYGLPMTRVGVGRLVIEIGKMAGVFTATQAGTHFVIGLAKSFFSASALFTGGVGLAAYATVAPIQAFAAGYATRVIGEATKVYLRQGASWGPAGPKKTINRILGSLDKDSILARIKTELQTQLQFGGHNT